MQAIRIHFSRSAIVLGLVFTLVSGISQADTYEVTVTNLTKGQSFTPRLAIAHSGGKLFNLGAPAIDELAIIAEGGNVAPMMELLENFPEIISGMAVGEGLIMPGDSQTITIEAEPNDRISLVNMLIPTNDGFLGINGVALPSSGKLTYMPTVYDAGTETNDELCTNIPGPICGGEGVSEGDDGEGYIYIHPGIHGIGDLESSDYDWKNPAAMVVIEKI